MLASYANVSYYFVCPAVVYFFFYVMNEKILLLLFNSFNSSTCSRNKEQEKNCMQLLEATKAKPC